MTLKVPAKIVCGACHLDPEIVTDADGNKEAVCPNCRRRDNLEDVERIGKEHAADVAARAIQETMRGYTKGNVVKFTPKPLPKKNFRWHTVMA